VTWRRRESNPWRQKWGAEGGALAVQVGSFPKHFTGAELERLIAGLARGAVPAGTRIGEVLLLARAN